MAASYPASQVSFTPQVDFVSVDSAENINALQNEIMAIELVLGTGAGTGATTSTGPTVGTIGAQITYLQTSKAAAGHTHTILPAIAIGGNTAIPAVGGATSGVYIGIGGTTINSWSGSKVARLNFQSNGGDISLGTAASVVSIYGTLNLQGSTQVTDTVTTQSMDVSGDISCGGEIVADGVLANVITAPQLSTGYLLFNDSGNQLQFSNGACFSALDPSTAFSIPGLTRVTQLGNATGSITGDRIATQGQLWAHKNRVGSVNDWTQSPIITGRTNEEQSSLGFAGLNEAGVGSAWAIQVNSNEASLGFMHRNGDSTYAPVTASGFVTASSARFKNEVRDLPDGLDKLAQLRPVSFTQSQTGHHVNGMPKDDPAWAQAERARERTQSEGERRRANTRHHGLIAEEVHQVLPEVVGLDQRGRPEGIDYNALIPVLINSIKELQARVVHLETAGNRRHSR